MRIEPFGAVILLFVWLGVASAQDGIHHARLQRAVAKLRSLQGAVLILHANPNMIVTADGFRQEPFFYYFTGLENSVGAVLAIDGGSGETWLFLPAHPPFASIGLHPEITPGKDAERRLDIDHVVEWSGMEAFLATHASHKTTLYFAGDSASGYELPANLSSRTPEAPAWLQVILQRWPEFNAKDATNWLFDELSVQSPAELANLRSAATATTSALVAGMRAIRPGVAQRSVESAVESSCWSSGAHGVAFWPWAMGGELAIFPTPFTSLAVYDHLDREMHSGDLVRLDVGCEWDHYIGDLGRTVPVSGKYDPAQRETWEIFVSAYKAGAAVLRSGVTVDEVFNVWRDELQHHRATAKTPLAQHGIDLWSDRKNVPFWQIHTTNLLAGSPTGPLAEGTTINFEPIASVDGQAFFLEDMYVITRTGAEILTPGVPYSAEAIERAMQPINRATVAADTITTVKSGCIY